MGVLGLGDDETREEGAESEREACLLGEHGDGETDREHAEEERFAAACARDLAQDPRHRPPVRDEGESRHGHDAQQQPHHGGSGALARAHRE